MRLFFFLHSFIFYFLSKFYRTDGGSLPDLVQITRLVLAQTRAGLRHEVYSSINGGNE